MAALDVAGREAAPAPLVLQLVEKGWEQIAELSGVSRWEINR
jgi:hypothetical protein